MWQVTHGTVFFDEIADLEPEAQGFLLRFLDSGEVRPIGETESREVETRVIAATWRDLERHRNEGLFRPDLYARLRATQLRLPPLRERREDLGLLVEMLWQRESRGLRDYLEIFTPEVIDSLEEHAWPMNVRELMHVVCNAMVMVRREGPVSIRASLLCREERLGFSGGGEVRGRSPVPRCEDDEISVPQPLSNVRRKDWDPQHLWSTLESAGGNIPEAARILGISRSHAYLLYQRLRSDSDQDSQKRRRFHGPTGSDASTLS